MGSVACGASITPVQCSGCATLLGYDWLAITRLITTGKGANQSDLSQQRGLHRLGVLGPVSAYYPNHKLACPEPMDQHHRTEGIIGGLR